MVERQKKLHISRFDFSESSLGKKINPATVTVTATGYGRQIDIALRTPGPCLQTAHYLILKFKSGDPLLE